MATPILTPEEVRLFLQDREELNTLTLGIRFTPEMIEQAMINTVDTYNLMPPPTQQYTLESFPYRSLLLLGSSGYLLRSAAVGDAANQLSYSAGGVEVNDRDKAQIFGSLGEQFRQEFKEMAQNIKLTQNIAAAYGVKHSEYYLRSRGY